MGYYLPRSTVMFAIRTKVRMSDAIVLKYKMTVVTDKVGNFFTGFVSSDLSDPSRSHHTPIFIDNTQFSKWTRKIFDACNETNMEKDNINYWLIHNSLTIVEGDNSKSSCG
jgi:hypothetical protein